MTDASYSGVIFDLDGLLLDTERWALAVGPGIFKARGFDFSEAFFHTLVGTSEVDAARMMSAEAGRPIAPELIHDTWNQAMLAMTDPIPLRPGVMDFLEAVEAKGLPRAIATNSQTARAEWKLRQAGLLDRFDAVVGMDQVAAPKPAPDVYIEAARRLGLRPEQCAALDDSDLGVRAAVSAGISTVIQIPDMSPSLELLAHHQAPVAGCGARHTGIVIRMHFDLIQSISLAGKASIPNDDRAGCGDRHAWVIDGATDLGPRGLVGARGGAAWLAAGAHRAFAGASGALEDICATVYAEVEAAYLRDRSRDPVDSWELPRAALAAVALEGNQVVCAHLADCMVIHRSASGVNWLTPAPDRQAEQAAAAALGPDVTAAAVRTDSVLAERRAARNLTHNVLSIDAGAALRATQFRRAAVVPGDELLLMSDGFAALIAPYAAYDADGLFAALPEKGLDGLGQELRAIENADIAGRNHPRFKASDDATALWLRVA